MKTKKWQRSFQSTLDFNKLQRELLLAIRGETSQLVLSKRIGYKSNRVSRWESGEIFISWSDFCSICHLQKIPLVEAMRWRLAFTDSMQNTGKLVHHLGGKGPQERIAEKMGVSRSMISRWRSGKIEPSLLEVLQLIQMSSFSLSQFVSALVDIRQVPVLYQAYEKEGRERSLHGSYPWVAALLLYLRTGEYNAFKSHPIGYLAEKLGISVEREKRMIHELVELEVITERDGIYHPQVVSLDTRMDFDGNRNIRAYWTERCLQYIKSLRAPRPRNPVGYLLFNANPEMLEKITHRYLEFYQDVNAIIHSKETKAKPSDAVYLMNFQLIDVAELPAKDAT